MKELVIQALTNAIISLEKRIPQTKNETVYINIEDVSPLDIINFMKENNIPNNAYFGGRPNSYDAFDEVCLCYDISVPVTDKEKLKYCRSSFSTIAFKIVLDTLTSNGYKRIGFSSRLLRPFDDTTVYDMYVSKDFDRLVNYYSLYFVIND